MKVNGFFGIVMAALVCVGMTTEAKAEKINLVILFDSSGSIGSTDFETLSDAVITAMNASVPTDGSVDLQFSFVRFATGAPTTIIDQFMINDVSTLNTATAAIEAMRNTGGWTYTDLALDVATALYDGTASKNIINIVTDGDPIGFGDGSRKAVTIIARDAAISAGYDEISAEFVDTGRDGFAWLRDNIVYPTFNGTSLPGPGFIVNSTVDDFESAFTTKLRVAIGQNVVPEPGTYALFGLAAVGYAVIRRRRRNVA